MLILRAFRCVYSSQRQAALLFDQNGILLCKCTWTNPNPSISPVPTHLQGSSCMLSCRITSQRVRGPCRPLQGTKQPLCCMPLGPASSAFGDVTCYMHQGIVHVQPSCHPIVWLSRCTEAALAVFRDASLRLMYQCMHSEALVCLRLRGLAKQPLLDWHPHVHRLHRRPSFPPLPSLASLSWNGGAHSVTNAFFCVFVFQASRNVESFSNLARVEHGPNVLFLSAFFCPLLSCVSAEAERGLSPRTETGQGWGLLFCFFFKHAMLL